MRDEGSLRSPDEVRRSQPFWGMFAGRAAQKSRMILGSSHFNRMDRVSIFPTNLNDCDSGTIPTTAIFDVVEW